VLTTLITPINDIPRMGEDGGIAGLGWLIHDAFFLGLETQDDIRRTITDQVDPQNLRPPPVGWPAQHHGHKNGQHFGERVR